MRFGSPMGMIQRIKESKMISELFDGLWIGPGVEVHKTVTGYRPTDNLQDGIAVLNVADDFPEFPHHRAIFYAHAGLNDGPEDWTAPWGEHNSLQAYCNGIMMLDHMMFQFKDVFVHCHGGVSRSCFIVTIYIACVFGVNYDMAKMLVNEAHKHEHIHPKHDDRAPHVLAALQNTPFLSAMRMKDAALKVLFGTLGMENWIEGIFAKSRPDLRVVPEKEESGGETDNDNPE